MNCWAGVYYHILSQYFAISSPLHFHPLPFLNSEIPAIWNIDFTLEKFFFANTLAKYSTMKMFGLNRDAPLH